MAVMLHAGLTANFYRIDDSDFVSPVMKDDWGNFAFPSMIPVVIVTLRADYLIFKNFIPESDLQPVHNNQTGKAERLPPRLAPLMRSMNALYQVCAGMLLWLFLRRIRVPSGIAFVVALLWTAHPMNCENVCWVIERKGILCALFGFGALLAWTLNSAARYPLLSVLYLLAYGSKPAALGLLPIFALLEIFVSSEIPFSFKRLESWRRLLFTLAGPLLISAAITFKVVGGFSGELVDPPGGTIWTALLTDVEIFSRYIHHTVFPFRLTFFNSVEPIVSLADLRLWIYGAALLGIFVGLWWVADREKRPLVLFGILWFFCGLAPNSNLIAIPYWFQDRYAMLSIPGVLLSVMLGVQGALRRWQISPAVWRVFGGAYLCLIIGLLAYRASFYANIELLELDAAKHQPGSAMARLQAAQIFAEHMYEAAPDGSKPNPDAYKLYGKAAAFHYEGMLQCSDINNFGGTFNAKLGAVEILGQLGMHKEVKSSLKGWLPPEHLQMISYEEFHNAKAEGKLSRQMFKRYLPSTLARAWSVAAESSLQLAMLPSLPLEEHLALLNQAIKEADESLKLPLNDESGLLVKARALFQIAEIERMRNNLNVANEKFQMAIDLLKFVSKSSRWRGMADALLSTARPPQPPAR